MAAREVGMEVRPTPDGVPVSEQDVAELMPQLADANFALVMPMNPGRPGLAQAPTGFVGQMHHDEPVRVGAFNVDHLMNGTAVVRIQFDDSVGDPMKHLDSDAVRDALLQIDEVVDQDDGAVTLESKPSMVAKLRSADRAGLGRHPDNFCGVFARRKPAPDGEDALGPRARIDNEYWLAVRATPQHISRQLFDTIQGAAVDKVSNKDFFFQKESNRRWVAAGRLAVAARHQLLQRLAKSLQAQFAPGACVIDSTNTVGIISAGETQDARHIYYYSHVIPLKSRMHATQSGVVVPTYHRRRNDTQRLGSERSGSGLALYVAQRNDNEAWSGEWTVGLPADAAVDWEVGARNARQTNDIIYVVPGNKKTHVMARGYRTDKNDVAAALRATMPQRHTGAGSGSGAGAKSTADRLIYLEPMRVRVAATPQHWIAAVEK